nr:MAG TPA: hypothetical protein [Caudoviricetes sp.]
MYTDFFINCKRKYTFFNEKDIIKQEIKEKTRSSLALKI